MLVHRRQIHAEGTSFLWLTVSSDRSGERNDLSFISTPREKLPVKPSVLIKVCLDQHFFCVIVGVGKKSRVSIRGMGQMEKSCRIQYVSRPCCTLSSSACIMWGVKALIWTECGLTSQQYLLMSSVVSVEHCCHHVLWIIMEVYARGSWSETMCAR